MRHTLEDLELLLARRVGDLQLQHEAVHLCFWQWIGAFMFEWILGRQDQKGLWQGKTGIANGHLTFLHSL